MKRRQALFGILGLGAGLVAARDADAQRAGEIPVVGLLDAGERREWWTALRQQLQKLGYAEGKNIAFEPRYAGGNLEKLPVLAQELVRLKVAMIVTSGTAAAVEAKRTTGDIPIVAASGSDYVSWGLANSLGRPGRNFTGMTSISTGLTAKRLELLREILPKLSRLAVLWHAGNIGSTPAMREIENAASALKIVLQNYGVATVKELVDSIATAAKERAEALFLIADGFTHPERRRIAELALKHRLPTMHGPSEYVDAGGLVSYAPSYPDLYRRAAVYVDKILKGAKPGDLPIEQPTRFELVVNMKTAKAMGVVIPQSVLLRAERVIE